MKTIIKTNIKDSTNVTVKESVKEIYKLLSIKGSFILVHRIDHAKVVSLAILSKGAIKMVKQQ